MAVNERLNDFADLAEAERQFKALLAYIDQYVAAMDKASKTAKLNVDVLGAAKNLADLQSSVDKVAESNAQATMSVQGLKVVMEQISKVVTVTAGNMKINIQQLLEAKIASDNLQGTMSELTKQVKAGAISQDEYYRKMIPLQQQLEGTKIAINDYNAAIKAKIKSEELASSSSTQLAAETQANKLAVSQANAEMKMQIQLQNSVKGSIAEARLQWQLYNKELVNLAINSEDATTKQAALARQAELRQMMDERSSFIQTNVDSYTQRKINIGNYPDATAQLQELNKEMAALAESGQQDSVVFTQLAEKADAIKVAMGGVSGELSLVTKQLQMMAAAGQQDTTEFQAMTEKAQQLKGAVKEVQAIINQGLGPNAGTGSITTTGAQLSAVKVQMQELALAGRTDSEEFRLLAVEAQRLSAAMNEVATAVNRTASVGDKLTARFNTMGLRFIVHMAIFQGLMEIIDKVKEKATKFYESLFYEQTAMDAVSKNMANNFSQEAAEVETLRARFNALGSTMADKEEVVQELNDKLGNQIDKINGVSDAERFFVDKSDAFIKALQLRAQAQATLNVITEQYQKQVAAQANTDGQLSWFDKMGAGIKAFGKVVGSGNSKSISQEYDWEKFTRGAGAANQVMQTTSNQIDFLLKEYIKLQNEAQKIDSKYGFNTDTKAGKDKKGASELAGVNELFQAQKRYNEAVAELRKQGYEQDSQIQKAIFEDESKTLTDRLTAYRSYQNDLANIALVERDKEIATVKDKLDEIGRKEELHRTGKLKLDANQLHALQKDRETAYVQLQGIAESFQTKMDTINTDGVKKEQEIRKGNAALRKQDEKDWLTDVQSNLETRLSDIQESYSKEATILGQRYIDKEISEKQFLERMKKLKAKYDLDELNAQILNDELLLQQEDLSAENRLAVRKRLTKNKATRTQRQADDTTLNQTNALGMTKEEWDTAKKEGQAALELNQEIINLIDQKYQKELDALDEKKKKIDEAAQAEIDAINKSGLSQAEKEKKIAAIKAQNAAQDKQILQQQNALKRKQAVDDKEAAILSIIEKTGIAVIEALAIGGIAGPILAGVYGTIGAVQLAKVIAQQIPQYGDGTPDGGHPDDGPAWIGERYKKEYVFEPGKQPWSTDKPTLKFLKKGARVVPEEQYAAAGMGFMTAGLLQTIEAGNSLRMNVTNDYSGVENAIKSEGEATRMAIQSMPKNDAIEHFGNVLKRVSRSGNSTIYLKKYN